MKIHRYITTLCCIALASCAAMTEVEATPKEKKDKIAHVQNGKASWYSIRTNGGTKTASGKRLCDHSATAAHKTLPFGTKVKVINTRNNKSEVVVITDRGPFVHGRIIDVTIGTARRLGFADAGLAPVRIEVIGSAKI